MKKTSPKPPTQNLKRKKIKAPSMHVLSYPSAAYFLVSKTLLVTIIGQEG
jgi:hypothetical protein